MNVISSKCNIQKVPRIIDIAPESHCWKHAQIVREERHYYRKKLALSMYLSIASS